jgi:hypothetical protein
MDDPDQYKKITSLSRKQVFWGLIFFTALNVFFATFILGGAALFLTAVVRELVFHPFDPQNIILWVYLCVASPVIVLFPLGMTLMWSSFSNKEHGKAFIYGILPLFFAVGLFFFTGLLMFGNH